MPPTDFFVFSGLAVVEHDPASDRIRTRVLAGRGTRCICRRRVTGLPSKPGFVVIFLGCAPPATGIENKSPLVLDRASILSVTAPKQISFPSGEKIDVAGAAALVGRYVVVGAFG